MAKKFVVFIDTQVDFMIEGAALYVTGAQDLIGGINKFAYDLKSEEYAGALFTFDTHFESLYPTSEEAKQFPIHCVLGTPGHSNVINHRIVDVPTYTLQKGVFNMWEEENIYIQDRLGVDSWEREAFFDDLKAEGVDTVVIVGVAADFCVKWAVDGFLTRDFNVELPRKLTTGIFRNIDKVVEEDYNGVKKPGKGTLTITD